MFNNICILPKNVITQKFYSAWFMWVVGLIIVTAVMIILRVAILFSPGVRKTMLIYMYGGNSKTTVSMPLSFMKLQNV